MGAGTKLHRGSGLAIATLGAVDVTLEGRECNGFGTRKTLALLIYLAFSEVAVERETLAALFWDDVPEENARASLNVAVSQLRKKLPAYIVATRETVSLNRDLPLWIDAEAFARRWRAWQEAQGNAPYMTKPALRSLLETLALYQGHFLDTLAISAGAAFEEWVRFERERLQQMVLRALEEAATAYLHRRQYQRGVTLARRLLQFDPLRESSHQLMMLLLARQGQRNAALAHFEECRLLLNTELGVAPGPDIQALYERICTPTIQCRLPSRPSSTAGRADDLKQIQYRLCMPDCRLLAVTGSAGSGKTHLALEVAWAARDHFLGGVCFVPLAGRRSAASVARSIATALSLHLEETVAVKELLFYTLHNKEILLVLDGFEPQLPACELLAELLGHAPHVKLLVTSRERLEIPDAWHHTLGGLSYPGVAAETKRTLEELAAGYGAVDLFRQEAQKLDIDIADEPQERDAIRRICQLVDGLPLGIQLAAAWLPVLTCPEIAAEVSERLDFLVAPGRSALQREQSLHALLAHSLAGLTAKEHKVYLELSVFPGSFDRKAAEGVAGATLPVLRSLIDKSLVRRAVQEPAQGDHELRFTLPRLLQQYAREKLRDEPAHEAVTLDCHASYYTAFLQDRCQALRGAGQGRALREIDAESTNVRQAWQHATARHQVGWLGQATDGLAEYYCQHGYYQEGMAACGSALRELQRAQIAEPLQARLLAWRAVFLIATGRTQRGRTLLRQSLTLLKKTGTDTGLQQAFVFFHLSRLATPQDLGQAARLCERSVALYERHGDMRDMGMALRQMASVKQRRGQLAEALQTFATSSYCFEAAGDGLGLANVLSEWAYASAAQGALQRAEELARKAHSLYQRLDNRASQAHVLFQLGRLLVWQGKSQEATVLLDESLALYEQVGYQRRLPAVHALRAAAFANNGEYDKACRHLDKTFALANAMTDKAGRADALWLSGWINLAGGECEAAQKQLRESVALYARVGDRIGSSHAQAALACAEFHLGNLETATGLVIRALEVASDVHYPYCALAGINSAALVLARRGFLERAAEVVALSSTHALVARSHLFNDCVGQPLAAILDVLPKPVFRAAQERGKRLELWTTAEMLTGELAGNEISVAALAG